MSNIAINTLKNLGFKATTTNSFCNEQETIWEAGVCDHCGQSKLVAITIDEDGYEIVGALCAECRGK